MPNRTKRLFISSGSEFERVAGYSRVLVDSGWIFTAGTTGFNYRTMAISDSLETQVLQAIDNTALFLAQAGASMQDVLQCNWVITRREYFSACGRMLSDAFAPNRPVAMTLVCDLVDKRMKFEMQVIGRILSRSRKS